MHVLVAASLHTSELNPQLQTEPNVTTMNLIAQLRAYSPPPTQDANDVLLAQDNAQARKDCRNTPATSSALLPLRLLSSRPAVASKLPKRGWAQATCFKQLNALFGAEGQVNPTT